MTNLQQSNLLKENIFRTKDFYKILFKKEIAPQIKQIEIYAPEIALKAKAGQFVVLIIDEKGERIPLTLVDWEKTKGNISLIFQEVGVSTKKLGALQVGDKILHIAGPLGNPSHIEKYGSVTIICGGVGTAAAYPITRALKKVGNTIVSIIGARNKKFLILEDEMKNVSDKVHISTDDGSKGQKGFVSEVLNSLIKKHYKPNIVYAIGPPIMMKVIAEITKQHRIRTIVSLNPIMIDGVGMCGTCRVSIDGETKFACIDGPEFDAHTVNFNELMNRLRIYSTAEKVALEVYEKKNKKCVMNSEILNKFKY